MSERRMCVQQSCTNAATRDVDTNYGLLGWLCAQHYAQLEASLAPVPSERDTAVNESEASFTAESQ